MAVPRLVVVLIAGVLLIPAVFVMSRMAAGGGSGAAPPAKPAKPAPKPAASANAAAKADPTAAKPKPDPAADARKKAAAAGLPASLAVALAKGKTVVLFLSDGKSADDRSTADAVHGLKGTKNIKVFSDRLGRLGSYRAIVGRVGVTQSPAVVIVRGSKARVVEGYVDPETLRQQVLDAGR
jgi:hypothetical protein